MIVKREHDHDDYRDHDDRRDHDNDNGRAVAPAPSGGALTSLAALGATLNAVDTRPSPAVRAADAQLQA